MESLPDGKARAYTSVLSVMQVMEQKKYLRKKREGMAHRWSPVLKQEATLKRLLSDIVTRVFNGISSAVSNA